MPSSDALTAAFVGGSPVSTAIAWVIDCYRNDAGRLATDTVMSASVGQLGGFLGVVGRIAGVKGTEPPIVGATRVAASKLLAATTRWL